MPRVTMRCVGARGARGSVGLAGGGGDIDGDGVSMIGGVRREGGGVGDRMGVGVGDDWHKGVEGAVEVAAAVGTGEVLGVV